MTDNGSNFVKPFQIFNVEVSDPVDLDNEEITSHVNDVSDISIEEHDEIHLISPPSLSDDDVDCVDIRLPNNVRCACHTLSLICTIDAKKVFFKIFFLQNKPYVDGEMPGPLDMR